MGDGGSGGFGTERGDGPLSRFRSDERAIEGLPVRLVIALVVGVASLSVMLSMVNGIGGLQTTELDARPTPEVTTPGEQSLTVRVIGADGDPVADATVVVSGDTASLSGPATAESGPDGNATVQVTPTLGPNQAEGTLTVDIKPPAAGGFADRRQNTEVLVIAD
ncbi:carboxypeptidase regulatory-like domain-containing protein [Halobaculum sp. MBLA0147]|uniref:DUF7382 domain-containing protein n=1 Tax=Halobaculum sp. MBLA0147 TaxID=3079934 RepID=UPI0035251698